MAGRQSGSGFVVETGTYGRQLPSGGFVKETASTGAPTVGLNATGASGAFSGTANSTTAVALATAGNTGDVVGSAFSSAVVAAAVVGSTGVFSGSAGAGASAALASIGASGAFSGNSSVPATVSMGVAGGSGSFSGSTSSGSISAPAYSANRLSGVKLPAATQSAYDIALQRALVPMLNSIIIKLNQLGDGLVIGQNNLRTGPPLGGSWQAGDEVRNSAPAELGTALSKYVIRGWQCTASGTPGTWVQQRYITGN